ncbi:MAG: hypothetical protein KAG61_01850, partial [Bacteriovoracaceae bacterium]|nr:hypothetical protein [Bacteriovoracaceae bacterium]
NFSTTPYGLLHSDIPLLSNISVGLDSNMTRFRQLEKKEQAFIRNADRYTATPYINWNLGRFGPLFVNTSGKYNYQSYFFPHEKDRYFRKSSGEINSEIYFEIERTFGFAYKEKVDAKSIELTTEKKNKNLIGPVPDYGTQNSNQQDVILRNSYRHTQGFALKHYYTFNEKTDGNKRFSDQISDDHGLFDYTDALRKKEHQLENATFRQEIPVANTLEFKWTNSILRKSPGFVDPYADDRQLRDNFLYSKVAFFNLSQGYRLYDVESGSSKLTRLFLSTGLTVGKTSVNASEYFFYEQKRHIFNTSVSQSYDRFVSTVAYHYNNASDSEKQDVSVTLRFSPADIISTYFRYDYDIQTDILNDRMLGIIYRPQSKCWLMHISQKKTQIDTKYSFNFLINFNDQNFNSLDVM